MNKTATIPAIMLLIGGCQQAETDIPRHYQRQPTEIEQLAAGAVKGDADAQYEVAKRQYENVNYAESVHWYRKAANQGHAGAQAELGSAYYYGEGIPEDQTEAVRWWRKSAEQGNAEGQYNLGIAYQDGEGVSEDRATGASWVLKAAKQGHAKAQESIASDYFTGEWGVPEDFTEAYIWYRIANKHEELAWASIDETLGYLEGRLTTRQIAQAKEEATERAAEIEARTAQNQK